MISIAMSVTRCKFEATDAVSDEVVLMRIVEVLKAALNNPCGGYLSDEAVCQMMETCFSMCFQMRLSELLRKSAEQALVMMVQALFGKLRFIDEREEDNSELGGFADGATAVARMDGDISRGIETAPSGELPLYADQSLASPVASSASINTTSTSTDEDSRVPPRNMASSPSSEGREASSDQQGAWVHLTTDTRSIVPTYIRPYGLPSVKELLTFLISLLNPSDRHNTDTMRSMGLTILSIALEVGGVSINKFPSLVTLVRDRLSKQLFGLVNSREVKNPTVSLPFC